MKGHRCKGRLSLWFPTWYCNWFFKLQIWFLFWVQNWFLVCLLLGHWFWVCYFELLYVFVFFLWRDLSVKPFFMSQNETVITGSYWVLCYSNTKVHPITWLWGQKRVQYINMQQDPIGKCKNEQNLWFVGVFFLTYGQLTHSLHPSRFQARLSDKMLDRPPPALARSLHHTSGREV